MIDRRTFITAIASASALAFTPKSSTASLVHVETIREGYARGIFTAYLLGVVNYLNNTIEPSRHDQEMLDSLMNEIEEEIEIPEVAVDDFRRSVGCFMFTCLFKGREITWRSNPEIAKAINSILDRLDEAPAQVEFEYRQRLLSVITYAGRVIKDYDDRIETA